MLLTGTKVSLMDSPEQGIIVKHLKADEYIVHLLDIDMEVTLKEREFVVAKSFSNKSIEVEQTSKPIKKLLPEGIYLSIVPYYDAHNQLTKLESFINNQSPNLISIHCYTKRNGLFKGLGYKSLQFTESYLFQVLKLPSCK